MDANQGSFTQAGRIGSAIVPASEHGAVPDAAPHGLAVALANQIECGLIGCDGRGTLLVANRAARREVESGRVLHVVDGTLCCVQSSQGELRSAMHDAAQRHRSRLLRLGETQGLMIVTMPFEADGLQDTGVLVMMGRRHLCSALGLQMLAAQHGLTLAEQRVMRSLVDSRSAREIADEHGVAISTVRTQIQAVRAKLGVRNIDALLLRAAQVPPVTSWH